MRATVMFEAGDVRIEDVPDAKIVEPTDAVVRVTRACVCGSDLWPYRGADPVTRPTPMGHEYVDIVREVDSTVGAAYREKYGRYSGYVQPMVRPEARATTIELVPRSTSS